jgi:hypothetical protein
LKEVSGFVGRPATLTRNKDFVETFDYQRRMRSLCGMELGFNAEVQIYRPSREPDAVTLCHGCGFLDFRES